MADNHRKHVSGSKYNYGDQPKIDVDKLKELFQQRFCHYFSNDMVEEQFSTETVPNFYKTNGEILQIFKEIIIENELLKKLSNQDSPSVVKQIIFDLVMDKFYAKQSASIPAHAYDDIDKLFVKKFKNVNGESFARFL